MREQRLIFEKIDAQSVNFQGRFRHVAFRVEITMERFASRESIEQLNAADLDQAIAGKRVESRRFGIKDNFTHQGSRSESPTLHCSDRS